MTHGSQNHLCGKRGEQNWACLFLIPIKNNLAKKKYQPTDERKSETDLTLKLDSILSYHLVCIFIMLRTPHFLYLGLDNHLLTGNGSVCMHYYLTKKVHVLMM